jgi:hypothetical protein
MRSFLFLILVFLFVVSGPVFSQKNADVREQAWFAYFNQTRLTEKSGVWVDLQMRLNEFVSEKSLSIARLGYTYFLTDQTRLTAGYGYITHYNNSPLVPDVPENRVWQQVQWFDKKKGLSLMQYLRVEERFVSTLANNELTDDFRFTWRFRYNFALTIPLKGTEVTANTPFVLLNDELHINAGKNIINNYFDQNRLFAGVGYQFTSNLNAHAGYLYVFQQLPAGNRYIHINAFRLFVNHNLDFRKD